MSVNWSWNMKKGVITWSGTPKSVKVNIYQANCLGALIYEYKDVDTNENMYRFMGFWNDLNHLKRCLGLTPKESNIYEGTILKIKLNTYFKDNLKIAELFSKAGFKVELYYKNMEGKK